MSTKLNADKLAAKLYPLYAGNDQAVYDRMTAAHTIREVAQPIADELDEAVAALRDLLRVYTMPVNDHEEALEVLHESVVVTKRVNAILEKHSQ
jgi:hypothetical protein